MLESALIFELFMLKCHKIARKYNKDPRNSKLFSKNKKSLKSYEEPNISRDNEY